MKPLSQTSILYFILQASVILYVGLQLLRRMPTTEQFRKKIVVGDRKD